MGAPARQPAPGCVVEYLEDNAVQTALVLEESGGKLRLLLPSRREVKMAAGRALPWMGPMHPPSMSREEAVRVLEGHKRLREERAKSINPLEVWELACGEIESAPAHWFAELFETEPDADSAAAYGRALLACKTHFHFRPPEFEVYDEERAEKRLEAMRTKEEREAQVTGGANLLHALWDLAQKKRVLGAAEAAAALPDEAAAGRIERLLRARMINPDTQEDAALWNQISKGLPDAPHLPLQLLTAWGKIPPHYNFWLDRAGYEPGDEWHKEHEAEVEALIKSAASPDFPLEDLMDLPFISVDGPTTEDIDDAFFIERAEDGWNLAIALAFPALAWPFGSAFDKKIMRRATSLYFPEATCHMLPESLGAGAYSLFEGRERPVFCLRISLDKEGRVKELEPAAGRARLAANLRYEEAQAALDGNGGRAEAFLPQLRMASDLAEIREKARIEAGAVIMRRPEPAVRLEGEGEDIKADIVLEKEFPDAQRLVSEMMVLASAALADWAFERGIALIHRTQNVTLPKEYAGVWSAPADLTRIMRSLAPSILEADPRPHAALALPRYAPVTSPLRRYADLINEAQIFNFLAKGEARWSRDELDSLLNGLAPALDAAGQAQRFRPRYWKLLYFRQHGDREWWPAVITEENESFVSVALPDKGIFARGRRSLFDERACPGMKVRIRLGKANPLYNEIQILEAMPEE